MHSVGNAGRAGLKILLKQETWIRTALGSPLQLITEGRPPGDLHSVVLHGEQHLWNWGGFALPPMEHSTWHECRNAPVAVLGRGLLVKQPTDMNTWIQVPRLCCLWNLNSLSDSWITVITPYESMILFYLSFFFLTCFLSVSKSPSDYSVLLLSLIMIS